MKAINATTQGNFFVVIVTIVILLLVASVCVATLIVATRSASEGFEDDVGFHRVKVTGTSMVDDKSKRS